MKVYVCYGDVRGECGHKHRSLWTAAECLLRDRRACRRAGGYSDREIMVLEDGELRPLNRQEEEELGEVWKQLLG